MFLSKIVLTVFISALLETCGEIEKNVYENKTVIFSLRVRIFVLDLKSA